MTKQTEALKLALEALEETRNALAWFYDSYPQDVTEKGNELLPHVETVLTTTREALAVSFKAEYEQPAQPPQEPAAWAFLNGQYAHIVWGKHRPDDEIHTIPLYTSPPPCPTCEALARTVMLDQTSHDTRRQSRSDVKPLTDEQLADFLGDEYHAMTAEEERYFRLGEAAHGIKGDAA